MQCLAIVFFALIHIIISIPVQFSIAALIIKLVIINNNNNNKKNVAQYCIYLSDIDRQGK